MGKRNRQPPWNVYEAVLLIEAYLKVVEKKMTRKEAVKKVSIQLRNRAKNEGLVIDDTFRNENGINMRFGELEYLFSGGDTGLKNTSALFRDMVKLYHKDNSRYCMLLEEATSMDGISSREYEQFEKWMKLNASKVDFDKISGMFEIIEEFCLKINVLEKPLFETKDIVTIKRVRRTVLQNKIFKIKCKKHYNNSVTAIEWYFAYVYDLQKNNEITDEDEQPPEKENKGRRMSSSFESDFRTWLLKAGMSEKTCRSYISALHTAERFAQENNIEGVCFTNTSFEVALESISKLMNDEGFKRLNQEQHNRFSGSFQKLKGFISYVTNGECDIASNEPDAKSENERNNDSDISSINNEIEQLLLENRDGITKEEVISVFADYSTRQIKILLETCHAVRVLKKYYHRDNIFDYEEMAEVLLEVLNKQFEQNGNYTSSLQLYNEAKIRLDDFFFYNGAFDSKVEIYDFAVHLFSQEKYRGNSFVFLNNMHIWKEEPDYPKNFHGLMIKYAREHNNTFTRDDAVDYFKWIGSATPAQTFSYVIFNTGSKTFLQYDENNFVLAEVLEINSHFLACLKTQISNLLEEEDYIAFGEIDDFFYTTLPKLPTYVHWSPLLLEDILRIYNLEYFTVEAGKDNDKKTIPAALIKKNSPYVSFEDVVWMEVAKEFFLPKEFSASDFRDFLLKKGFIRGSEKMFNVHKTVAGDIRFFWTNDNSKVTIN